MTSSGLPTPASSPYQLVPTKAFSTSLSRFSTRRKGVLHPPTLSSVPISSCLSSITSLANVTYKSWEQSRKYCNCSATQIRTSGTGRWLLFSSWSAKAGQPEYIEEVKKHICTTISNSYLYTLILPAIAERIRMAVNALSIPLSHMPDIHVLTENDEVKELT